MGAHDRRPATSRAPLSSAPVEDRSYETSPPPLTAVPWVLLSYADILTLALDHRDGFLLSLIDGETDVATLIELAAMPRTHVLRVLARWNACGVIALRDPAARITAGRRSYRP